MNKKSEELKLLKDVAYHVKQLMESAEEEESSNGIREICLSQEILEDLWDASHAYQIFKQNNIDLFN